MDLCDSLNADPPPELSGPSSHYESDGREPDHWIIVTPAYSIASDADLMNRTVPARICRPGDLGAMAREGGGESPWALGAQIVAADRLVVFEWLEDALSATRWTGRVWPPGGLG